MQPETLTALKESIAHWERMESGTSSDLEAPNGDHCALCHKFCALYEEGDDEREDCVGCPIKEHTNESGCNGTPFYDARDAWHAYGESSPEFKAAARIQIAFLKSLLPENK